MADKEFQGFLDDPPNPVTEDLETVIVRHVLPFLKDWWSGPSPIPTADEMVAITQSIENRSEPLPAAFAKVPELLQRLAKAMRFNKRNFVNIHPTPFLPSVLAQFVVSIQNPNNIVTEVSEATSQMEREDIAWLAEHLFGLRPGDAWGNVVSGGTVANLTALMVARDYTYDKLSRPRPGRIGPRGVVGLKPGVVLATAGSHYSLQKALWFLGLGHENLIRVPVCWDEQVEMQLSKEKRFLDGIEQSKKAHIHDAIKRDREKGRDELADFYSGRQSPFCLQPLDSEILKTLYTCFQFDVPLIACVLTFGTTDTGTIEQVNGLAIQQLKSEDVFIHADAAIGGFAALSEKVRPRMEGFEHVDSFTVDGHKTGFLQYPCGAVIFRDKGFLQQIHHEAPYLVDLAPTLEGSRPGGGAAALWIAIQTLGAEGYRAVIDHLLIFTQRLAAAFASGGAFQVLHRVDLNTIAVAPLPQPGETRETLNSLVKAVRERVVAEGDFLVNLDRGLASVKVKNDAGKGSTQENLVDIHALRIVATNPLVELSDAERLATMLARYLEDERARRASAPAVNSLS